MPAAGRFSWPRRSLRIFRAFRNLSIDDGVAEIPTVILSVGVVPLGFGGSPYRYLSDIAEFQELDTAQTSTGQQLPITVILVNPVTTDDADP